MEYQIYLDRSGKWRWRLVASNYEIIADSGQGYVSKQGCLRGIELVQQSHIALVRQV